jgi:hypothetical protein
VRAPRPPRRRAPPPDVRAPPDFPRARAGRRRRRDAHTASNHLTSPRPHPPPSQDAAAAAAPAERKVLASGGSSFSGDGTAYSDTVRDGAAFACSYRALPAFAQSHFAAVPPARWENGAACGRCVSVKCVDERCAVRGEARVGMVVDKCPECADGDIDM